MHYTPSACASPEYVHCAAWVLDWAEHLGGPQGQSLDAEGGQNQVADHRVVPAWVLVLQKAAHLVEEGCSLAAGGSSDGGKAVLVGTGAAAGGAPAASVASR